MTVNGKAARIVESAVRGGVVDWEITLSGKETKMISAAAIDKEGNAEQHAHEIAIDK